MSKKRAHSPVKSKLHPRSQHRSRYDFVKLCNAFPELKPFVAPNKYGDLSIDFFNPKAVLMLNTVLLKFHYKIDFWEIPDGHLCPPIPGRADYIHYIADLISLDRDAPLKGGKIKCFDVGVGANCIYPIIGHQEYGWRFVGTESNQKSFDSATKIVHRNPKLRKQIDIRFQTDTTAIFKEVVTEDEFFDVVICNPPFHKSQKDAEKVALKKLSNLKGKKVNKLDLNFGGQQDELWIKGGELGFLEKMIRESQGLKKKVRWFTSLVSKKDHLNILKDMLSKTRTIKVEVIPMAQGNKESRILAWTYISKSDQEQWMDKRT